MSRKFSKDDIDRLHDYGIHIPTRTLYMGSEFSEPDGSESGTESKMAEKLIKNLHILDAQSSDEITIIMNNLGGSVIHGMAIFDAIKKCRSHVTIRVYGHVMSMGSIILQAADKRILSPHSIMMVHHGWENVEGHVKSVRNWTDFGKKYDMILNKIYLDRIREKNKDFTIKKLDKMLDFDTILLPSEAVQLGLADEVESEK